MLKIVFPAKVRAGLKRLFRAGKLLFAGQLADLSSPKAFFRFLEPLCEKERVVYAKAPFRGPDHLLQYLARYTHRVAISNHRLIPFDGESDYVAFIAAGIPSGSMYAGDDAEKSPRQARSWGGQADQAFDPCYHSRCDRIDDLDRTALDRNTDAVAGTLAHFATSTEPLPL